jgi:probable F420-dependent oxidoreductase
MSPCPTSRSERKTRDRSRVLTTPGLIARYRRNKGVDMRIGVVFPQTEIGPDAGAVRAYGEHVEGLGFAHLLAYDHIVGADPKIHVGWDGPYDLHSTFHEPLVTFGYLAAVTTSLELVTGIVILPQRQAVLVAKQAAEVDLLSGGRLRLGVGLGWNEVEYEALGEDFSTRGKRCREQVELMRMLWTEETVTYRGTYHRVTGAGLAPLPIQRPIPVWFGASSARACRRAGRLGDGWFPMVGPGPKLEQALRVIEQAATEVGRDPAQIAMEGRVSWNGNADELAEGLRVWADAGASHVSINTMGAGLTSVDDHLAALTTAAEAARNFAD